jgi:hypothetical protein
VKRRSSKNLKRAWRFVVLPVLPWLAACATPPPPEFALYQSAFAEADQATKEFVQVWAPIERQARAPKDQDTKFDPDQAAYYTENGRPGLTAQIERGFAAIALYNDVLARYAAGESVTQLRPALTSFAADGAALATLVGAASVAPVLAPAAAGVEALAGALLAAADRAAFQASLSTHAGAVSKFIDALREQTPIIFSSAVASLGRKETEALAAGRNSEADQLAQDRARFRTMLADWVLLLEQLQRSTDALEQAVIHDQGRAMTAADLAYWTADIRRHTESVKLAARLLNGAL